jgi:hypothetical protein
VGTTTNIILAKEPKSLIITLNITKDGKIILQARSRNQFHVGLEDKNTRLRVESTHV